MHANLTEGLLNSDVNLIAWLLQSSIDKNLIILNAWSNSSLASTLRNATDKTLELAYRIDFNQLTAKQRLSTLSKYDVPCIAVCSTRLVKCHGLALSRLCHTCINTGIFILLLKQSIADFTALGPYLPSQIYTQIYTDATRFSHRAGSSQYWDVLTMTHHSSVR